MAIKKITVNKLEELSSKKSFGKVLDVGCGEKIYKPYINHDSYIGIDVKESGHDIDKKNIDEFFNGEDIPFNDNYFDFILCTEVLEHAVNPEKLIQEMRRVLKDDGLILITVPSMWGEHETPYDFRRYTSYGIKKLALDHNLVIVDYLKESIGVSSFIRLGLSEVNASSNNFLIKKISRLWLLLSRIVLLNILRIEMPRIYLTNLIVLSKNNFSS